VEENEAITRELQLKALSRYPYVYISASSTASELADVIADMGGKLVPIPSVHHSFLKKHTFSTMYIKPPQ
jgi:hypothetical protein